MLPGCGPAATLNAHRFPAAATRDGLSAPSTRFRAPDASAGHVSWNSCTASTAVMFCLADMHQAALSLGSFLIPTYFLTLQTSPNYQTGEKTNALLPITSCTGPRRVH